MFLAIRVVQLIMGEIRRVITTAENLHVVGM